MPPMQRLGCISTRRKLISKGVGYIHSCPHGLNFTEDDWHTFVDCEKAKQFCTIMEANSIKDLLFSSLTHLPNDLKCKFSMILWSIWKNRNEKVWNNLDISPATSISLSDQFYSEWSHARRKSNNIPSLPAQQVHGTWEPPPLGYITCNVAIFQDINAFGADLCIRAKGWALFKAIQWISQLDFYNAIFESDCKFVVDSCNKPHIENIDLHVILAKCCFKKRQTNCCSHFDTSIKILCL
ncbi:hypothetical protein JHK85_009120 [Glycine max]|nr:hypothetical protein JHK87_008729 [Glycine soja]KAG5048017.1 hypothetical protein JHK85_009120 [Glycine max]